MKVYQTDEQAALASLEEGVAISRESGKAFIDGIPKIEFSNGQSNETEQRALQSNNPESSKG